MSSAAPESRIPDAAASFRSTSGDAELYLEAFAAAPVALLFVDADTGEILAANATFAILAGREPVVGQQLGSQGPFRENSELSAQVLLLAAGQSRCVPVELRSSDGARRDLEITATGFLSGSRRRVRVSIADVTARRMHERRARQIGKMEALRQLANGTAHDFNNMLSCVKGYVSVVLESRTLSGELRDILTQVRNATVRAGEFTQRLLEFGRQRKPTLQLIEVGSFVTTVAPQLQAALPPRVQLRVVPSEVPVGIMGDPEGLRRALCLLVTNAQEATGESGEVALSVAPWTLPSPHAPADPSPGERYARLSVSDRGKGMSPAVRDRLFEPGFTTKKTGGVSGISLATVYRIAAQHGGWVDVETAEGQGSTFALLVPLSG